MASAWGSSWGKAWGNSWGATAPPIVPDLDTHDGYPNHRADIDREAKGRRDRLRNAVETAFRRALVGDEPATTVEVPTERPATKKELRQLAVAIQPAIETARLDGSLGNLQALLSELQMAFVVDRENAVAVARKRREDEAIMLLMLLS